LTARPEAVPLARPAQSAASLFRQGVAHHEAGRLPEAEALYRQVLAISPRDPDALNSLGLLALQVGRADIAIDLIGQAVSRRGSVADYHGNLGAALRAQGRLDEAAASFRRALKLRPSFAEMLYNLGNVLLAKGEGEEAIASYRKALRLRPNYPDALNNLGNALRAQGELEAAADAFRQLLVHRQEAPETHFNLGSVLADLGQVEAAAVQFEAVVRIAPDHQQAHFHLGNAMAKLGRPAEALACFEAAVRLNPDDSDAQNHLGAVLRELGAFAEAEGFLRAAIRLRPDHIAAHSNLGIVLSELGRASDAEWHFRHALRLQPETAERHNNLGIVLRDQGKVEEAEAAFRRAISLHDDYADVRHALATTLLLAGRLREGFELFEWRRKTRQQIDRKFAQPDWDGGPLEGRVLLLHEEQGIGDAIQFLRYVPLIRERVAPATRIVLEVQRPLLRLSSTLAGDAELVVQGGPLPAFDVQCPLLSLARVFGTELETIPAQVPYLGADPADVARWQRRLAALGRPAVGITWAGNPTYANDRKRSISFDRLAPLFETPGVAFVSLQKGAQAAELGALPAGRVQDWTEELADFADTAALISALDLTISVDTAVAHLAGALGRPIWLLNRFDTDWRWLLDRDDSPWYPTLRQFRQPKPGNWESVVAAVRAILTPNR
jgi:tetratricopeptide (TPR) repeat protein